MKVKRIYLCHGLLLIASYAVFLGLSFWNGEAVKYGAVSTTVERPSAKSSILPTSVEIAAESGRLNKPVEIANSSSPAVSDTHTSRLAPREPMIETNITAKMDADMPVSDRRAHRVFPQPQVYESDSSDSGS